MTQKIIWAPYTQVNFSLLLSSCKGRSLCRLSRLILKVEHPVIEMVLSEGSFLA